ncbi:uncharacterized protein LOC112560149 [Pomacea canaliculata]|uniref:uncharacterized protein LOC112560149 n=1 Tax=Pomacea canaliculata TaxID=400727 RepID=UPI000D734454|nr:uncharacterized protein LOC112560149 [Pomacea canaliculata]
MIIKPISIAAYVLTVVAVILLLAAFIPPSWCVVYRPNMADQRWHGLWSQKKCDSDGDCKTIATGFEIEGGREFFFIVKIFHLLALVLAALGLLLHTVYPCASPACGRSLSTRWAQQAYSCFSLPSSSPPWSVVCGMAAPRVWTWAPASRCHCWPPLCR